jgi:nucleotide-binding universal stress UspA family protein
MREDGLDRHCRRVLVPYDFSADAGAALEIALDVAVRLRARLYLVHVVPPGEPPAGAAKALAVLVDSLSGLGCEVDAGVVEAADVTGCLLKCAASLEADLIVMGAHDRAACAAQPLGGVAQRMLRHAACAVLTVRADDETTSTPRPSPSSARSQTGATAVPSRRQAPTKSGREQPSSGGAPTIRTPRSNGMA